MYKKLEEFQKSKLCNGFYTVNGYFIRFCGIALTCVIFAAVVMRYCFKLDFFGSEEIILLFAWWMYFLGGIGGSQEDSQIKADMVEVFCSNRFIIDLVKGLANAAYYGPEDSLCGLSASHRHRIFRYGCIRSLLGTLLHFQGVFRT